MLRKSAIIAPDEIIINLRKKLPHLHEDESIVEIEIEREFMEKFYKKVSDYFSSNSRGLNYRGKETSIYHKIPLDIFHMIARSFNMGERELAGKLYEMNMLYIPPKREGAGYRTRAQFRFEVNREFFEELGLDPDKPWKPWVYSVIKLESYEKILKSESEEISYRTADDDVEFAKNFLLSF